MLNIVLVEPEIPANTGNISRTCACTGAALHLVRPLGFEITDTTLKRAGLDYWDKLDVYYYDSFEQVQARFPNGNFYFFTSKAKKSYTDVTYCDGDFLVFGKETKGLDEKLIQAHILNAVRIPMTKNLRCLNLSNSAAVAVYEALRQLNFPDLL